MCGESLATGLHMLTDQYEQPVKPWGDAKPSLQSSAISLGAVITITSAALAIFGNFPLYMLTHLSYNMSLGLLISSGGRSGYLGLSAVALTVFAIYNLMPLAGVACAFAATLLKT